MTTRLILHSLHVYVFVSPKEQGETDCLKKAKHGTFMQHGQKAESSFNKRLRAGNSKRDIAMADYVYPNILLESRNPLSRRDVCIQDRGTGTNTGPKTGVVRVTYQFKRKQGSLINISKKQSRIEIQTTINE